MSRTTLVIAARLLTSCVGLATFGPTTLAQSLTNVSAKGVADPTRPPAALAAATASSAPGQTRAARTPDGSASRSARAIPLPQLQSVHLPHEGPASALVDDRLLRVGERINEWQVERIEHDGLLLRSATTAATARTAPAARQLWLPLLPATAMAAAREATPVVDRTLPAAPNTPHLARTAARKEP
jgi:hypothetical protein